MSMNIEDIQTEIKNICISLYGEVDKDKYFLSPNDNISNVRNNILSRVNEAYRKNIYLDSVAYIFQMGDDVFITLN